MGIDGRIYPVSAVPTKAARASAPGGTAAPGGTGGLPASAKPPPRSTPATQPELDFMDVWYPIQVKQKDKAGRPDIDSFEAVMARENRTKGFFISFDFSSDALTEIDSFFRKSGRVIIPLTVREILDEQIAKKLA